jgi:site-specific recombinase
MVFHSLSEATIDKAGHNLRMCLDQLDDIRIFRGFSYTHSFVSVFVLHFDLATKVRMANLKNFGL